MTRSRSTSGWRGGAGSDVIVGVLALQGDVAEHLALLSAIGVTARPVRRPGDLEDVDALVLPGGESTTIGKLCELQGLLEPLRSLVGGGLPTLGTCAGAILLGREALRADGRSSPQPLLGVLDTVARRNAFGRQVASFETLLDVEGVDGAPMRATFIRAPWFEEVGDGVQVLARVETGRGVRPVVVGQGNILACAFHPELDGDDRLHRRLVTLVDQAHGEQAREGVG